MAETDTTLLLDELPCLVATLLKNITILSSDCPLALNRPVYSSEVNSMQSKSSSRRQNSLIKRFPNSVHQIGLAQAIQIVSNTIKSLIERLLREVDKGKLSYLIDCFEDEETTISNHGTSSIKVLLNKMPPYMLSIIAYLKEKQRTNLLLRNKTKSLSMASYRQVNLYWEPFNKSLISNSLKDYINCCIEQAELNLIGGSLKAILVHKRSKPNCTAKGQDKQERVNCKLQIFEAQTEMNSYQKQRTEFDQCYRFILQDAYESKFTGNEQSSVNSLIAARLKHIVNVFKWKIMSKAQFVRLSKGDLSSQKKTNRTSKIKLNQQFKNYKPIDIEVIDLETASNKPPLEQAVKYLRSQSIMCHCCCETYIALNSNSNNLKDNSVQIQTLQIAKQNNQKLQRGHSNIGYSALQYKQLIIDTNYEDPIVIELEDSLPQRRGNHEVQLQQNALISRQQTVEQWYYATHKSLDDTIRCCRRSICQTCKKRMPYLSGFQLIPNSYHSLKLANSQYHQQLKNNERQTTDKMKIYKKCPFCRFKCDCFRCQQAAKLVKLRAWSLCLSQG